MNVSVVSGVLVVIFTEREIRFREQNDVNLYSHFFSLIVRLSDYH